MGLVAGRTSSALLDGEELITALKELEMRHGAHTSTVLLAGWAAVLRVPHTRFPGVS